MRKLIIAYVLTIFICQLNYAQSIHFKSNSVDQIINIKTPQPLSEVLDYLANKEKFQLAYESYLLEGKYCTFNTNKYTLLEALDIALVDSGLEYKLSNDGQILIRTKIGSELDYIQLFGQIRDKSNKKILPYTNISILNSSIGSYSDSMGQFKLTLPNNLYQSKDTVVISRIGYKDRKIPLAKFVNNTDLELEIQSRVLPFVTILAPLDRLVIRNTYLGQTIDNSSYSIPSFGSNDILRKLQFLPSITANKDNSAKIRIRGSKSYETLILLDGIIIYNPTHFYEVFSAINDNYIGIVNFYKNNIPIDIQSMTGGVVQLNSKEIDFDKTSAKLGLNLMDYSSTLNLPLSKEIGLSFSFRKSIFDHTRQSFFGDIISANQDQQQDDNFINLHFDRPKLNFDFYDINGKILWKINKNQNLQFTYYRSNDIYLDEFDQSFDIKNKHELISTIRYDFRDMSEWKNMGMNLLYQNSINNKYKIKISLSDVLYEENSELFIKIIRKKDDSTFLNIIAENQYNQIKDRNFKFDNTYQLDKKKSLKFGLDITNYVIDGDISVANNSIFENSTSASAYTFYTGLNNEWRKLKWQLALRSSYYSETDKYYYDPSFSIQYRHNNKFDFYISINKQHQYLRAFDYETRQSKYISFWSLANDKLPILSVVNYSIGGNYKHGNSSINFELYKKNKTGLGNLVLFKPVFDINKPKPEGLLDYRIFIGEGYIWGFDFLWQQILFDYSSQLAYTYSINEQRYTGLFNGAYFPSPDDSRHQIKWIQNYTYKKTTFGLNMIYSSGTPYFDFSTADQEKERRLLDFNNFIELLPAYYRMDFSVSYKFKLKNKEAEMLFSIFNLTNRTNVVSKLLVYSDRNVNGAPRPNILGNQTNLLSRTINLGFNINL